MKTTILTIGFTLILSILLAQENQERIEIDEIDKHKIELLGNCQMSYKLFETNNMWTFIKLNTRNGQMTQVQYSMDVENRFETYLNLFPLVLEDEEVNGRFDLYQTSNIWTFLLLDCMDGRIWQVQWSQEPENRGITRIK